MWLYDVEEMSLDSLKSPTDPITANAKPNQSLNWASALTATVGEKEG